MSENKQEYGCKEALTKLTEDQINVLEDYAYLMVINHERHRQERESEYRGALGGYLNGLRDTGVITQSDVNVLRIYFVDKAREEVEELKKGGEL